MKARETKHRLLLYVNTNVALSKPNSCDLYRILFKYTHAHTHTSARAHTDRQTDTNPPEPPRIMVPRDRRSDK